MKQVLGYLETIDRYGHRRNWKGKYIITVKVVRDYWDTNTGFDDMSVTIVRDATKKDMEYYRSSVKRLTGSAKGIK